jgi:thioredoxin 1
MAQEVLQKPLQIKSADFEKEVLDHPGIVLVEFFATWCGHCQMFAPTLEIFAKEKAGQVKVVLIDVNQAMDLAKAADVQATPTIILFNKGKKFGFFTGVMTKEKLEAWIDESIKKA